MEWRLNRVRTRSLSVAARIGFHKSTASMKLVGNIQQAFIFRKLKAAQKITVKPPRKERSAGNT